MLFHIVNTLSILCTFYGTVPVVLTDTPSWVTTGEHFSRQCGHDTRYNNISLVLNTGASISKVSCARACHRATECQAFNVQKNGGSCEIVTSTPPGCASVKDAPGWTYYGTVDEPVDSVDTVDTDEAEVTDLCEQCPVPSDAVSRSHVPVNSPVEIIQSIKDGAEVRLLLTNNSHIIGLRADIVYVNELEELVVFKTPRDVAYDASKNSLSLHYSSFLTGGHRETIAVPISTGSTAYLSPELLPGGAMIPLLSSTRCELGPPNDVSLSLCPSEYAKLGVGLRIRNNLDPNQDGISRMSEAESVIASADGSKVKVILVPEDTNINLPDDPNMSRFIYSLDLEGHEETWDTSSQNYATTADVGEPTLYPDPHWKLVYSLDAVGRVLVPSEDGSESLYQTAAFEGRRMRIGVLMEPGGAESAWQMFHADIIICFSSSQTCEAQGASLVNPNDPFTLPRDPTSTHSRQAIRVKQSMTELTSRSATFSEFRKFNSPVKWFAESGQGVVLLNSSSVRNATHFSLQDIKTSLTQIKPMTMTRLVGLTTEVYNIQRFDSSDSFYIFKTKEFPVLTGTNMEMYGACSPTDKPLGSITLTLDLTVSSNPDVKIFYHSWSDDLTKVCHGSFDLNYDEIVLHSFG